MSRTDVHLATPSRRIQPQKKGSGTIFKWALKQWLYLRAFRPGWSIGRRSGKKKTISEFINNSRSRKRWVRGSESMVLSLEREGERGCGEPRVCVYLLIPVVKGWRVCRGQRDFMRNGDHCAISSRQDKERPPLGAHMWEARGPGCQ